MDNYYIKYLEDIRKINTKIKSITKCNETEEFKNYLTNSLLRNKENYDFPNHIHKDNSYVKNSKNKKNRIEKIKKNLKRIKNLSKECEKILIAMEEHNKDSQFIYESHDLNREIMIHNICIANFVQKNK